MRMLEDLSAENHYVAFGGESMDLSGSITLSFTYTTSLNNL